MIKRRFMTAELSIETGSTFTASAHYTQRAWPVQRESNEGLVSVLTRPPSRRRDAAFPNRPRDARAMERLCCLPSELNHSSLTLFGPVV